MAYHVSAEGSESAEEAEDFESQTNCIIRAISTNNGAPVSIDAIVQFLKSNWKVRAERQLEGDQLRRSTSIILDTNPCFDEEEPDLYVLGESARIPASPPKKLRAPRRVKAKEAEVEVVAEEKPKRGRPAGTNSPPPPGYTCACGATEPGRGPTCKWRKGPRGFLELMQR